MNTPHTEYNNLAEAFDLSAPFYDDEQAANPVARWNRRRSLAALDRAFGPGDQVVELGCGTGAEAIYLAERRVRVLATDVSPGMIAQLEAKLTAGGAAERTGRLVQPRVMAAGRAHELVEVFGPASFSGAYSSFGALNCEPSLVPVAAALATLVRPGGRMVISLINRYCLWETGWYLLHGEPGAAFRRLSGSARATVRAEWQDLRVAVYYWSPGEVEQLFAPQFAVRRRMALPWLLPPQYLAGLVRRAPRLFRRLASVERRTAGWWPFYALGDHFLLEMERKV